MKERIVQDIAKRHNKSVLPIDTIKTGVVKLVKVFSSVFLVIIILLLVIFSELVIVYSLFMVPLFCELF